MPEDMLALIARARYDTDAFVQLFEKYKPVALGQIRQFQVAGFSHDDWLQEAKCAMCKCLNCYDPSQGSKFGSYYHLILRRHFISILRKHTTQKRAGEGKAIQIGASGTDIDQFLVSNATNAPSVEDQCLTRADLNNFFKTLSSAEAQALLAHVHGNAQQTHNHARALARARVKLRAYLEAQKQ
ncbi:sigma-70 family RNA polymerase sigma factor [Lacticaseibacillus hulanensis]|uniref:sigma-70 family RNA polymerase sigma factor n=1 Tax=Lacticaseibacillus hulanensis TaxID=2493111 RepID=UPI000FD76133|nr:sigma-70 family RNA polymerase sigma factor [Lacticaseibacillus hulanensis]